MSSAVSARSLWCCAIRSLGTAADRPPVSRAPVVFIFLPSIRISSGIKRFQPDKMLILVVSSGQRPVLPDVFWFGARSLVFSSVTPQWHVCRRKVRCRSSFPAELGPFRSQGRGRLCLSIGTRCYLQHPNGCHGLFAPLISGANKWCK